MINKTRKLCTMNGFLIGEQRCILRIISYYAEAVGFELTTPCGVPVFKTGALDQLCDASAYTLLHFNLFFKSEYKNKNRPLWVYFYFVLDF